MKIRGEFASRGSGEYSMQKAMERQPIEGQGGDKLGSEVKTGQGNPRDESVMTGRDLLLK